MVNTILLASLGALALLGCASWNGPMAVVTLEPSSHCVGCPETQGTVHFEMNDDGSTQVQLELKGVPPGKYGFHIQESDVCSGNVVDPHARRDLGD